MGLTTLWSALCGVIIVLEGDKIYSFKNVKFLLPLYNFHRSEAKLAMSTFLINSFRPSDAYMR